MADVNAEELFSRATKLHQEGNLSEAMRVCTELIERFPGTPKAELAKTLIAGMQQEKSSTLWNAAADARSHCAPAEAVRLYAMIIRDFPDSTEAKNARTEIANTTELERLWNAALKVQAETGERQSLEAYRQINERYPNSPEAENASLMMAIINQSLLTPKDEAAPAPATGKMTPAKIVAYLLAHKKATRRDERDAPPDVAREEQRTRKIEALWTQALALEQEKNFEEAAILYRRIIETSSNNHRVRDAKYQIEKIRSRTEAAKSYSAPEQWGLKAQEESALGRFVRNKAVIAVVIVLALLGTAGVVLYRSSAPPSWTDIVERSKKAIVVVKTPSGAGTGFLMSRDGTVLTNAHLVAKETDIELRLYSGVLKKATVVKTGTSLLDIAVLKIDGFYDDFLPSADTDECREGSEVRVLGAPLGMEYFVTKGIISHCNLDRDGVKYIQTDPAINVGHSGGPCLNARGRVIGLSTSVKLGEDAEALNLILPISLVKDFMAGRVTALEEALSRKEEERARELAEKNRKFYEDLEALNQRFQRVSEAEHREYLARLTDMLHRNRITSQQGDVMVEQVKYGPTGDVPMAQWVQSLALRVSKGELSEPAAIKLIKDQYQVR